MSITITKIGNSTFSYQENDNPIVTLDEKAIVLEKKTGIYWLKLPENSLNRKLVSTKKFDDTDVVIIDKIKTQPTRSSENAPKAKLLDFLTEEELDGVEQAQKYIDEMMATARARREEARNKPLTEKEKAQKKLDKAINELKSLGMTEEEIQALLAK